jgi:primosomal protein N'
LSPQAAARVVDVVVQQRTARVERPLTYEAPAGLELQVGDVVRVPLGPRELYGYVISAPHERPRGNERESEKLRAVAARIEAPPAFDREALALARWIAGRYCCSLGEALAPFVLASAMPRVVDRFERSGSLDPARFPALPPRLLRLLNEDFGEGFALDALLRHPEARRAGERRVLLAALGTLVRANALVRRRAFVDPRVGEARERFLEATGTELRGPRLRALVAFARETGGLRRRDAYLAGARRSAA